MLSYTSVREDRSAFLRFASSCELLTESDLICNSQDFQWLITSTLGTSNFEVVNIFNSIYELKYPEGAQV